MNIKYVEGDLFKAVESKTSPVVIPHVCNDKGGWGAGFVLPLSRHYPLAEEAYRNWASARPGSFIPFWMGQTQIVRMEQNPLVVVANMVAQTLGGERPLHYNHLATCMNTVAENARVEAREIMCPMFGAGLAGGDWNFIEQLIVDAWVREDIPVTVFYLPGMLPKNWTLPSEVDT